jgi:beta-lactamase class A
MQQSTLAEILGVEQEIRAQLDAEREQASRWLEDQRREIERTHAARLSQLRAEAGQRREVVLGAARERAATVVRDAEAMAAAHAAVDDGQLRPLVLRHLADILPESLR